MPGYVQKMLVRFKHEPPPRNQYSPYQPQPRQYGKNVDDTIPVDESPLLDEKRKRVVQQVIGTCLYYARAVDCTILPAISSIASTQAKATEETERRVKQLLDYLATLPNAKVRFHASKMVLNVHSDASYLSEPGAKSRAAGIYFMGDVPENGKPISLNGNIFVVCGMLKFVAASAAEAELGALFINGKETKILRLILEEMGHPQPQTPVHCDNKTATGIANDTVKKHRSRSMEMRYFWVTDQVHRKILDIIWQPGAENLADYFSKHHIGAHHKKVRSWYIHTPNSSRELPRALAPSALRGCVGTLEHG